jgi:deoxyribonuclease V
LLYHENEAWRKRANGYNSRMSDTPEPITHAWDLTPEEAIEIQRQLAARVLETNGFDPDAVRTIAGIDVSLKEEGQAAVAVLSYPDFTVVDRAVASAKLTFPYVPGLLSFRETPLVLAALEKLRVRPDLLMVDGQGRAHPRRFGIACHVGLLADLPAIGVAKSVLCGRFGELGAEAGSRAPLIHRKETIGIALRAKVRTNPLIISVGHKVDLETAVLLVERCLRGYRLPEPTRAAHNLAGSADTVPVENPRQREAVIQTALF